MHNSDKHAYVRIAGVTERTIPKRKRSSQKVRRSSLWEICQVIYDEEDSRKIRYEKELSTC